MEAWYLTLLGTFEKAWGCQSHEKKFKNQGCEGKVDVLLLRIAVKLNFNSPFVLFWQACSLTLKSDAYYHPFRCLLPSQCSSCHPFPQGPPRLGFHCLSFRAHLPPASPASPALLSLPSLPSISVPLQMLVPLPEGWSPYVLCFAQILVRFATHQWMGPKSPPLRIPHFRLRAWSLAGPP